MRQPVLLDVGPASDCCTDHALEALYKALIDPPDDASIWRPHESSLIRALVEHFSAAGTGPLASLQADLEDWLAGKHSGGEALAAPGLPSSGEWTGKEISGALHYLAGKPQPEWTADDWQMLVDALVHKHLPLSVLQGDAEGFAVKAYGMGAVQAASGEVGPAAAEAMAAEMPSTVAALTHAGGLTDLQQRIIEFAKLRCCNSVVGVTEAGRAKLRAVILDHQERAILGDRAATASALQTKLFDTFADWNRDWRRIAVSELGENLNQGLIASLPPGTLVKRIEVYAGACAFCRKIDGRVMKVVDPGGIEQDGETEVWVGKTNLGRSPSPRKRVGNQLIERTDAERFWLAAGIIHPHCRGRWVVLREPPAAPAS